MILRKRGSSVGNKVMPNEVLYHIGISAEMLKGAEYALLPGDPGRVEALARALGTAEPVGCHREYTSWLADVDGSGGKHQRLGDDGGQRRAVHIHLKDGDKQNIQHHIGDGGDDEVAQGAAAVAHRLQNAHHQHHHENREYISDFFRFVHHEVQ